MNDYISFLITLLRDFTDYGRGYSLTKCALRVKRDQIPQDCVDYPLEPENAEALHRLLPLHLGSIGPILEVEVISDIHIAEAGE